MTRIHLSVLMLAVGLTAPCTADAVDTIVVNGTTFQCQTQCVVQNSNTGMWVSDSMGGWVQMMVRGRAIPAPSLIGRHQDEAQ